MDKLKIYYKTEKDGYFVEYDVDAIHYIELNFESKQVRWCYHLPLPKGLHWKAGDQMGGLGADHHVKTQSFGEFIEKPHIEMPPEDLARALKAIQESK